MGYVSDWNDAERHAAKVHAAHPDCDGSHTCPAGAIDNHVLDCRRRRRMHKERMAAVEVPGGQ